MEHWWHTFLQNSKDILEVYGSSLYVVMIVAVVVSLLGVFVVLNRIVFIGITLSEVAAFGIALGLVFHYPPLLLGAIFSLLAVSLLSVDYEKLGIPRDSFLGVLFLAGSSLSILMVSKSSFGLEKIKSILYGNILFAGGKDLLSLLLVSIPTFLYIIFFLKGILYSFLDEEFSLVIGVPVKLIKFFFFFFLGLMVSVSSKVAGLTLVFSYLVIFPSLALLLSRSFGGSIIISIISSVVATYLGIYISYLKDWPPNQSVVMIGTILFFLSLGWRIVRVKKV